METVKRIWFWIVRSSENPKKLSLTLKGLAGTLLAVVALFNITLVPQLGYMVDFLITGTVLMFGAIGALTTAYGAFRKISNTWFK